MQRVGSRAQVMHGNAKQTAGGLEKKDLKYNKQGKIVSKKMSTRAKKEKRLQKAGYITKKGQFGAVRTMSGGNDKKAMMTIKFNKQLLATIDNIDMKRNPKERKNLQLRAKHIVDIIEKYKDDILERVYDGRITFDTRGVHKITFSPGGFFFEFNKGKVRIPTLVNGIYRRIDFDINISDSNDKSNTSDRLGILKTNNNKRHANVAEAIGANAVPQGGLEKKLVNYRGDVG